MFVFFPKNFEIYFHFHTRRHLISIHPDTFINTGKVGEINLSGIKSEQLILSSDPSFTISNVPFPDPISKRSSFKIRIAVIPANKYWENK